MTSDRGVEGASKPASAEVMKDLLVAEYTELKREQSKRIGFRDNMVFVQLASVGSVGSWVLTNLDKPKGGDVLLVIPWVCLILGWTYIVNDNAISRIGLYVREIMNQRAEALSAPLRLARAEDDGVEFEIDDVFGWEVFHRADSRRKSRKSIQWVIDEVTFCAPGLASILIYVLSAKPGAIDLAYAVVLLVELGAMFLIGAVFFEYNDFKRATPRGQAKPAVGSGG